MSEETHTPGPWEVGEVIVNGDHPSDEAAIIFLPDGAEIEIETKHSVADAHLIASAPDLLAERDRLREINTELQAALIVSVESHYATWMAARAEVEGATMSEHLFEREPDIMTARAVIAKSKCVSKRTCMTETAAIKPTPLTPAPRPVYLIRTDLLASIGRLSRAAEAYLATDDNDAETVEIVDAAAIMAKGLAEMIERCTAKADQRKGMEA